MTSLELAVGHLRDDPHSPLADGINRASAQGRIAYQSTSGAGISFARPNRQSDPMRTTAERHFAVSR